MVEPVAPTELGKVVVIALALVVGYGVAVVIGMEPPVLGALVELAIAAVMFYPGGRG